MVQKLPLAAKARLNWVRKYKLCGLGRWANLIVTFQSLYHKPVISLNLIIRAVGLQTDLGLDYSLADTSKKTHKHYSNSCAFYEER